jgi:hypothetical protein
MYSRNSTCDAGVTILTNQKRCQIAGGILGLAGSCQAPDQFLKQSKTKSNAEVVDVVLYKFDHKSQNLRFIIQFNI